MPVPSSSREDQWIWTKELMGGYSVKSMLGAEQAQRAPTNLLMESTSWNILWKLKI